MASARSIEKLAGLVRPGAAGDPLDQTPPLVPPGADLSQGIIVLAEVWTDVERRLVNEWLDRFPLEGIDRAAIERFEIDDPRLGDRLSRGDDPLVVPVRVAWVPPVRGRSKATHLFDLVTLNDPRRPRAYRQSAILRWEPDRCRLLAGAPATASELRERWMDRAGGGADPSEFVGFVARQAVLALERAELAVVGARYKVPQLVIEEISGSARFREKLAALAEREGRPIDELAAEAQEYFQELVPHHSNLVMDAFSGFGRLMYGRAYEVEIDRSRLEELRELNRRHALVFLPAHKSYLDWFVVPAVFDEAGFPPNHTLAGINLDFFPLGPLARRSGTVFLRRTFRDNGVYKLVLREYFTYLVSKRFNIGWAIEGGRTRTGKLRPPKYGLLTYVLDGYTAGEVDDVMLVPISVAYDQLYEVAKMAEEAHGAQKQAEGVGWLIDFVRAQGRGFGTLNIGFGEPISVRASLGSPEQFGAIDRKAKQLELQKLALKVCVGINQASPVTPLPLVTLALLGVGGRALTLDEVRSILGPLLSYIERRGLPTTGLESLGTGSGVTRVLDSLSRHGVVEAFDKGPEPVWAIGRGQELVAAFYRNGVIHWFVDRAIMELALVHAAAQDGGGTVQDTWEECLRLRDLLKFEFFFTTKREFDQEMRLETSLLDPEWESKSRAMGSDVKRAIDESGVFVAHRVLRSFIEAYKIVADCLAARDPRQAFDQGAFLEECQHTGRMLIMQQRLASPESVSRELFGTAIELAGHRDLLDPGREELTRARQALAEELESVSRRVALIDQLDAEHYGRRAMVKYLGKS
ncbi:MAG TPA: glycerol-3-phosphate 1-O-acyltransferase [Solirubrobacteraceae bacterium]|jgi:glycerol-3-phosphate O-acyltransferase|nr:glycerol-3-phosphate 1-O-acyltransferase [Solirubrobacteraceae bacterium]